MLNGENGLLPQLNSKESRFVAYEDKMYWQLPFISTWRLEEWKRNVCSVSGRGQCDHYVVIGNLH